MQIQKNMNFSTFTTYFVPLVNICFDKMPKINGISPLTRESKAHSSAISTMQVYVILYLNTPREAAQIVSKQPPTFPYASSTKVVLRSLYFFLLDHCSLLVFKGQRLGIPLEGQTFNPPHRAPSQPPNEARIIRRLSRK